MTGTRGNTDAAARNHAPRPYDLVVFDEAHKLAAHQRRDLSVDKTDRYRLAEALAGLPADEPQWELRIAQAHEEVSGATAHDVSRPELARRAGLGDWPGFDLLSIAPAGDRRAIEVEGRARTGDIELSENEWAKACNLRDGSWLYAVYDVCATPRPRLVRVRDPFGKLLVRSRESAAYSIPASAVQAAADKTVRDMS